MFACRCMWVAVCCLMRGVMSCLMLFVGCCVCVNSFIAGCVLDRVRCVLCVVRSAMRVAGWC